MFISFSIIVFSASTFRCATALKPLVISRSVRVSDNFALVGRRSKRIGEGWNAGKSCWSM